MAQLRDARTSELLAEGSPVEVAAAARAIGFEQVLFDDVPPSFDPEAILALEAERVDGLKQAASATKDAEAKESLKSSAKEAEAVVYAAETDLAEQAAAALDEARARIE